MPSGEIVNLHIGQAGVQIGHALWELLCLEHGIYPSGLMMCQPGDPGEFPTAFFSEQMGGTYVPRAMLIDLEPTVIDEVRTGAYRHLFSPDSLISGKEDAANNFARGYYTLGHEFIEVTMDRVRRLAERCNSVQGFFLCRSLGGGTGSGFAGYLIEKLAMYYGKKTKVSLDVFPSPHISTAVVEPYNTILTTHCTMDNTDVTFIYDNEALYNICSRNLDNYRPSYTNINRIMAQVISSMTAAVRFDGSVNVSLLEFQTNLVPYPRIHFPVVAYAPIVSAEKAFHDRFAVNTLVNSLFERSNQMVVCNTHRGRYIACSLLFRGDVTPNDVNSTLSFLRSGRGKIPFVDWSPSGFKVGLCYRPPTVVPGGDLAATPRAVVGMMNSTAIRQPWVRLSRKYDTMLRKRAFVHWYVGEGMEEMEFYEAREDMLSLQEDYRIINTGKYPDKPAKQDMTVYGKNIEGKQTSGPATKRKGR